MPIHPKYKVAMEGLAAAFTILLLLPAGAHATQAHGHPEGIYTHQLAHIFFMIAMGALIYWLRARNLVMERGWRYIQIAAALLLLWNVDALAVHFLEEQLEAVTVSAREGWQVKITAASGSSYLPWLFYLIKLDHLICVPALVFLYLGLRKLIATVQPPAPGRERAP
ncbi:MAG: hypothetical protein WBG37_19500 [Desulfobacterales bacterium]